MAIFTEAGLAYPATQRLGRLATAQPNGTLQANPVGYEYNADLQTIDIGGRDMGNSQKYRNVRANGRRILSWGVDPDRPGFSKRTVKRASDS